MTRMSEFRSRGPVIHAMSGPWARIVDADGLGARQAVTFEREVVWVRVAEARVMLADAKGRVASPVGMFSDVSDELLACLPPAIETARSLVARDGLRPGHPLTATVRVTVRDLPSIALPPERWDMPASPPRYMRVPADWIAHGDAAVVNAWLAKDQDARMADLGTVRHVDAAVLDGGAAWLSSNDRDANAALLDAVIRAATAGMAPARVEAYPAEFDWGLADP